MPNITMCANKTCPLRFPPGAVTDQCEYFVELRPTDTLA